MDASLFSIKPRWMWEVKTYLQTSQMAKTLTWFRNKSWPEKQNLSL
jgi:hypothetical protein